MKGLWETAVVIVFTICMAVAWLAFGWAIGGLF